MSRLFAQAKVKRVGECGCGMNGNRGAYHGGGRFSFCSQVNTYVSLPAGHGHTGGQSFPLPFFKQAISSAWPEKSVRSLDPRQSHPFTSWHCPTPWDQKHAFTDG